MKMIIACRRHPDLSRSEFFAHLRHVHWPLLQQYPAVLAALGGYVQNHALGASAPCGVAPFRLATERDSVIEAFFDAPEQLGRLVAIPEYLQHVRPDEARFNDLSTNLMMLAQPALYFDSTRAGRCKRFDFIVRDPAMTAGQFKAVLAEDARRLVLDPFYTAHVDRHVHNQPLEGGPSQGFGQGSFGCVREVWAASFEALAKVASLSVLEGADRDASFSILATEFVMKPPREPDVA